MSLGFCDFVPDDPTCPPKEDKPVAVIDVDPVVVVDVNSEPTPTEPTQEGQSFMDFIPQTEPKMEREEKEDMDAENPMFMMGNLAFLGVAAGHVAGISLDLFRYKSATDYYDAGATYNGASDNTNWWKISNQISYYGALGVSSILTITQLLSMFGVAVSVNVMAWSWSMMLVMPLIGMAAGALKFYAYETFYSDDDVATTSSSSAMMGVIELECMQEAIMELSSAATLSMNWEGWMWAQYLSADEETQAAWRESHREMEMAEKKMWERESGKDGKGKRDGKGMDSDSEESDDSDESDDEELQRELEKELERINVESIRATEEFAL